MESFILKWAINIYGNLFEFNVYKLLFATGAQWEEERAVGPITVREKPLWQAN